MVHLSRSCTRTPAQLPAAQQTGCDDFLHRSLWLGEIDHRQRAADEIPGSLKEFTGISDPYEVPPDAEVTINTGERSPEEAAQEIILHLEREGFIGVNGAAA